MFSFRLKKQTSKNVADTTFKYPPPYERLVWEYRKENIESIKKSVEYVNWDTLFNNKAVNKQVSIFNETIINIFSSFVPNKLLTSDDCDAPWRNDFIKFFEIPIISQTLNINN